MLCFDRKVRQGASSSALTTLFIVFNLFYRGKKRFNLFLDGGPIVLRKPQYTTKSGPSSAYQGNAIKMVFRWHADDGPTLNDGRVAL